jgi:hypothetical protein
LQAPEYPEGLDEEGLCNFLYLQACYLLKRKPQGVFSGDARIAAKVILQGGDIVDMYRAGADALYAALISNPYLTAEVAEKIYKAHIPCETGGREKV